MQSLKNKVFNALRSSERLFKLDMVYLAKGGWWTTLSFLVGILASVITMIAFGNLLPRETYGTYNYLLSLGASLSFLTLTGIGAPVMRAVARGYESVVPTALRFQLKYNLLAVATILTAAAYYGYKGNALFAGSLAMLAFAYPIAEAFHIYAQVLTGKKRFDTLTKVTSAITLLGALITVAALLLTDNILILIGLYASMALLPKIIIYAFVTRHLDKTPPDPQQVREMKRTAFHLTYAGVIGVISSYIDKIILFQVAGPAALAVYGFAIAGPERLKSLIKNWMSIALPRLANKSLEQIRQIVYQRLTLSLAVGLSLTLFYWFSAPILFKIFLPRYLDAILYSQVLSLGLIVTPISVYIGSIFASQNMLRATYALNIGVPIVRIALYLVFVWLWQIWGLVAASLLSSTINAFYSIIIWEVEIRRLSKQN
ncbi:MAG: oligosaccharide flippase family protein [bacterium]|nr:oligosaccharide flippase family protein [bacterium]